jgi:hypothetical protein
MKSVAVRMLYIVALMASGPAVSFAAQSSQSGASPAIEVIADGGDAPATPAADRDADEQVVKKPAGPPPTPRHTGFKAMGRDLVGDLRHLPSTENLFWAGVGGGLAIAVHPADDNMNRALVGSDFAQNFFKPGEVLGELPTLLGSAAVVYAVGRLRDQPKISHMGMDLIQSLAISEALTQTIKHVTGRERPDRSSHTSFPSGHAADTFAFATALERHLGWKGAVPAYVFSSYVAISRLPANRHWFSDAVFGSAVGIIAGRTVTRHGREFPITVSSVPGGAAIVYVSHPH